MAQYQMIVLFINSILVILVAGQTELQGDVEIISGRNVEQLSDINPLDAKYAGQFSQNIYAPPNVSSFG